MSKFTEEERHAALNREIFKLTLRSKAPEMLELLKDIRSTHYFDVTDEIKS